jgi:hypothetical protein
MDHHQLWQQGMRGKRGREPVELLRLLISTQN